MITKFNPKDTVRIKPSLKKRVTPALGKKGVYGVVVKKEFYTPDVFNLELRRVEKGKEIARYRVSWLNQKGKSLGRWYTNSLINEEYLMMRKKFVRRHPLTTIFKDIKRRT